MHTENSLTVKSKINCNSINLTASITLTLNLFVAYMSMFVLQPNSERNPLEEMLSAEASGNFVYVPPEEGGDDDPVAMDTSDLDKPESRDHTTPPAPKSPAQTKSSPLPSVSKNICCMK